MAWYARKCEFSRLNLNIHIHFHFYFHFQFHCEDERFFTFNFNFTVKTNTLNLSLSISLWGRTHFCFQFQFTVKMNTLLLSLSISLWRYDLFVSTNDYTWGCNLLLKIKTKQENWKKKKEKGRNSLRNLTDSSVVWILARSAFWPYFQYNLACCYGIINSKYNKTTWSLTLGSRANPAVTPA